MVTLTIEEKLARQTSFSDWIRENLTEDEKRDFYFSGGARLGDELFNAETAKKLKISMVENDNGTVTELHEWDSAAKNNFLKDEALASAYNVFERYQEYLGNL